MSYLWWDSHTYAFMQPSWIVLDIDARFLIVVMIQSKCNFSFLSQWMERFSLTINVRSAMFQLIKFLLSKASWPIRASLIFPAVNPCVKVQIHLKKLLSSQLLGLGRRRLQKRFYVKIFILGYGIDAAVRGVIKYAALQVKCTASLSFSFQARCLHRPSLAVCSSAAFIAAWPPLRDCAEAS